MRRPTLLLLGLLFSFSTWAQTPRALIDATTLRQQMGSASAPLLLDASPTPRFQKAHIPGAVSADFYVYGMNPGDTAAMQQRLRRWGVSQDPGQKIVIYDAGADNTAARVYFDLLAHGVPASRLQLLDGGLHQWQQQGGAVQPGAGAKPAEGNFQAQEPKAQLGATLSEFVSLSGQPAKGRLVEALEPQYYYGGEKMFQRGGHVPNALMLPWRDLFNEDKTFKKPEEIAKQLSHLGLRADQPAISYCGGGVAAAVPFFAMRALLDWPQARLYVGSQREYLMDERQLPLQTYADPSLLRDRAWLSGWNNPLLRMFNASHITVLDLRGAEAFAKERLPGAINLPFAEWRALRNNPAGLAEKLSAAGARPDRELVLVSDRSGLSSDKALALLMLNELGHRRASLLSESVDDWALAGGEMEKGPAKPAMPGGAWAAAAKVSTQSPASSMPSLRVDIGAGLAPLDGRSVPLQLTQLLQANGEPKSAYLLWEALQAAGVDRYANLQIRAADPADAATAHALLRLAGYPRFRLMDR
jgi:thiosulfate/3-mercaptopyruvate sulfurtransferase